ncbi:MAG: choice-of-anchor A family protein [Acidobacteriaceae bacterium]|nr:choice-of-anchor A family protein [Acidobacteriaceae bacterium]
MRYNALVAQVFLIGLTAMSSTRAAAGQSLGPAASFAVFSSADVAFKNRVNISQPTTTSMVGMCPGSVGCPADVGGTTVLMGRGNAAAPDTVAGDVIASAVSTQGLNCSGNPPGTTAICLGNDSEISGACVTGGGAIDSPNECAAGTDTTGSNSELTSLPGAQSQLLSFSNSLASLPTTQTLAEIALRTRGTVTIMTSSGLNVIAIPAITTGANATITISGPSNATVVINIGSSTASGSLQLGNGASVVLSGGITPDRLVFNLVGSSTTAQLGNNTTFNGTIVAPQGQFTSGDGNTPSPIIINGALLFGGSVDIGNNTNLSFYPFVGVSTGGGGV